MKEVLVVVGPSCSGKTTLCKYAERLFPEHIWINRGFTSRKPRPDDWEFDFRTREEMNKMHEDGELMFGTIINGERYGTSKSRIVAAHSRGQLPILLLDWQGYWDCIDEFGAPNVYAVFVDADDETIAKRMEHRNYSAEFIKERNHNARERRSISYSNELYERSAYPVRRVNTSYGSMLECVNEFLEEIVRIVPFAEIKDFIELSEWRKA